MKKVQKRPNAMTLEIVHAKQISKAQIAMIALKTISDFRIAKSANATKLDQRHSNACQVDLAFAMLVTLESNVQNVQTTITEVWMVLVKLVSVMKSVLRHYNANQMENVVAKLVTSQTSVKLARKIISEINPDNAKVCNFK